MASMSSEARGFAAGTVAAALVIIALLAGLALVFSQGAAQTCARSGGEWVATDHPVTGGVERSRECNLK